MEHGKQLDGEPLDFGYIRHSGYQDTSTCLQEYYSKETICLISRKVTQLTRGVNSEGRPIVVPDENIIDVMNGVHEGYRPETGDIYSRYIVENNNRTSMVQSMIDQTIEIITSDIRNNLGMEEHNRKLSAWVQLYGDFNTDGLRQHAPIKVREKRPSPMQFHMRY